MFAEITKRRPHGLADRLLTAIGFRRRPDALINRCAPDRFAALDDPATRKALSKLPPHLLRDIGLNDSAPEHGYDLPAEGDALRKHFW